MARPRFVVLLATIAVIAVLFLPQCTPAAGPAGAPPHPSNTKTTKVQTQPKTGSTSDGLDQKTLDEAQKKISAQEGDTAGAIRGLTAAPPASTEPAGSLKAIGIKGVLSNNSENANNDPDPEFQPHKVTAVALKPILIAPVLQSGQKYLKDLPNAKDLATRASDLATQAQIDVALLGQHKYMINDCLGVKVSVGQFTFKLANPTVSIVDEGVVTKFKVDEISFTAFKLRFRPDPTDLIQPCHFSGRVEVGGKAKDIVVTLTYNPVVDIEKCQIGNPGEMRMHLDIGSVSLVPVPSQLTNPLANMVEDAMNFAFNGEYPWGGESGTDAVVVPMLFGNFYGALTKALEENCPGKQVGAGTAVTSGVDKISSGATAAAPTGAAPTGAAPAPAKITLPDEKAGGASPAPAPGAKPAAAPDVAAAAAPFTTAPAPNAKGRLGWLVIKYPEAAVAKDTRFDVFKTGDATKPVKSGYGELKTTLLPGDYDVIITKHKVTSVPVKSGNATTIKVGVLKTTADKDTNFAVHEANGKEELYSGYGEQVIGLPVGDYTLDIGGATTPVSIKDGEAVEY